MSLRNIVIFLLMINLGYFAYSQGWLTAAIGSDAAQREPERVSKQVNPDAIAVSTIVTAKATVTATPAITPAPSSTPPAELQAVAAPVSATCTSKREQWVVYMGPYANKQLRDQKKAELSGLGLTSESISKQSLKIGLSLGEFESEASAKQALSDLSTKGVKTATIVLWGTTNCS